jgi:hypothetical protein
MDFAEFVEAVAATLLDQKAITEWEFDSADSQTSACLISKHGTGHIDAEGNDKFRASVEFEAKEKPWVRFRSGQPDRLDDLSVKDAVEFFKRWFSPEG